MVRIGVHFEILSCQNLEKIMHAPSVRLRIMFALFRHGFSMLDPRSGRAGKVELQFLNMRAKVSNTYFIHFFSLHFGVTRTSFAPLERRVKGRTRKHVQ